MKGIYKYWEGEFGKIRVLENVNLDIADKEFIAIMGSHAPFEYVSVKSTASAYTYYRDKYIDKLGRPEEDEYISTDQTWAVRSGLLGDEDAGFVIPY